MNTNNEIQAGQKNKTSKHSLDYRSILNSFITQMSFSTIKRHYILNHGLCTLLTTNNMHRPNISVVKRKKMLILLWGMDQVVLLCVVDAGSENTPVHERGWLCLAPQCCTTPLLVISRKRCIYSQRNKKIKDQDLLCICEKLEVSPALPQCSTVLYNT